MNSLSNNGWNYIFKHIFKRKRKNLQAILRFQEVQLHQAHDQIWASLSSGNMEAQQSIL